MMKSSEELEANLSFASSTWTTDTELTQITNSVESASSFSFIDYEDSSIETNSQPGFEEKQNERLESIENSLFSRISHQFNQETLMTFKSINTKLENKPNNVSLSNLKTFKDNSLIILESNKAQVEPYHHGLFRPKSENSLQRTEDKKSNDCQSYHGYAIDLVPSKSGSIFISTSSCSNNYQTKHQNAQNNSSVSHNSDYSYSYSYYPCLSPKNNLDHRHYVKSPSQHFRQDGHHQHTNLNEIYTITNQSVTQYPSQAYHQAVQVSHLDHNSNHSSYYSWDHHVDQRNQHQTWVTKPVHSTEYGCYSPYDQAAAILHTYFPNGNSFVYCSSFNSSSDSNQAANAYYYTNALMKTSSVQLNDQIGFNYAANYYWPM